MDHGIQVQDDEPRRKIQSQGEADLPELIWRNGTVAMAVGGETSRRRSPPFGTFLEEEIFTEEEMTWFLQYQIDDDCGGGRIGREGCRFPAPMVDEAGEGEEQRIDVKLGHGMIGEATEKVKMMDPAPIIVAAIVDKAVEEQRIDVELGQGNPEEKVMDSEDRVLFN